MTPFEAPGKQAFRKHSQQAISPFPSVFSAIWRPFSQCCPILNCRLQTL